MNGLYFAILIAVALAGFVGVPYCASRAREQEQEAVEPTAADRVREAYTEMGAAAERLFS